MKTNLFISFGVTMLISVAFISCDPDVNDGNNTIPKIVMALQEKSIFETDEYLTKKGFSKYKMDTIPSTFETIAPIYYRSKQLANMEDSALLEALNNIPIEMIRVVSNGNESTPYYFYGEQRFSSKQEAFRNFKSWVNIVESCYKHPDLWFAEISHDAVNFPGGGSYYCEGPLGEEYLQNADSSTLWLYGSREDFKSDLFWLTLIRSPFIEVRMVYADEQKMGYMVRVRFPAYYGDKTECVSFTYRRGDMTQFAIPQGTL